MHKYQHGFFEYGQRDTGFDVDETLGPRKMSPLVHPVMSKPRVNLTVNFDASGSTAQINHFLKKPIDAVHSVWLMAANFSGIVGSHNNLRLHFHTIGSDNGAFNSTVKETGFPGPSDNTITVPCNGAAAVYVSPGSGKTEIGNYRQPKSIDRFSLKVYNQDGVEVAYDECVLWLRLDVDIWQ